MFVKFQDPSIHLSRVMKHNIERDKGRTSQKQYAPSNFFKDWGTKMRVFVRRRNFRTVPPSRKANKEEFPKFVFLHIILPWPYPYSNIS